MTRVLLADDQAVVRIGLRMILESHDGFDVVGEAGDGREAVALTHELQPDVVLMDIRMPNLDGIEATRRIVRDGLPVRVLVLTTYGLDENVYDALAAGASGFLVKTDSPDVLVQAVRAVAAGDVLLGPETTRRLVDRLLASSRPNAPAPPELDRLTEREAEVLQLIAQGMSNAEIGRALFVTEGTVKTHVARVLAKLGCRDRVQAVVYAYRTGIVGTPPERSKGASSALG